jgi:hypothetical protein
MNALDKLKAIQLELGQKPIDQEKWPRQYAKEIIELKSREERLEALSKVPEHLRDWVKRLVLDHFERRKHARSQHEK